MGMYTEIQGVIKFKTPELALAFVSEGNWNNIKDMGFDLNRFESNERADCIPFWGDGVKSHEGVLVSFHSELKNYWQTIEKMIEILPVIADSWCLESKYEEYSYWDLHRNGEPDMQVNGTNDWDDWRKNVVEYPDFDVFDLSNLK